MRIVQKKICLLGDFAVGKTSLVRRYVEDRFDDKYLSTIGVKISRKVLLRDTYQLNLIVWDLAGGEDYSKMGANYLRGAVGALIVCDLTRLETLTAYDTYSQQLLKVNPDAVFVYAGNKVDLEAERTVSDEMLQERKSDVYGPCLLTSAKTGQNVEEAFTLLAEQIERQL